MEKTNNKIILAIETSCDDTCVAVIKITGKKQPKFKILANIVSSQVKLHAKYGGVYPTLARREHQRNLIPVLKKALKKAGILEKSKIQMTNVKQNPNDKCQMLGKILEREPELLKDLTKFLKKYEKPKVDAIAITVGPGLDPCLWVGVNFAKVLSFYWNLPIIPVNHIEGHILANLILPIRQTQKSLNYQTTNQFGDQVSIPIKRNGLASFQKIFPAICLVVSGGHTQLILMKSIGRYKIIGETRDDAAGECFDKVARILGLGYPGGPAIAAMAARLNLQSLIFNLHLPRPMIYQKNYDFSFSGLKTAVLYDFKKRPEKTKKSKQYVKEMAKEIQQAIVDVLVKKTIRAAKDYKVKSIIIGGGVSSNKELRKQFKKIIKKEKLSFEFYAPNFKLSSDNAAMIGVAGYFNQLKRKTKNWQQIKAKSNLRIGENKS